MTPDKHDKRAAEFTVILEQRLAFAAALRQIEAETIDRCAKVAQGQGVSHICIAVAAAILALKEDGK